MSFQQLVQAAMLGTERARSPALSDNRTILGQLISQLDPAQSELSLLSMAALSVLHEQTGRLPSHDTALLPPPCPEENLPCSSKAAASLLLRMLAGEYPHLLPEWLALAAQASQLAPPEALPALLNAGTSTPEMRETILPALGERGRWLAALNPLWSWVNGTASEVEGIWQIGEFPARLLFLQRLRHANPDRARDLLACTWKEERPEDRAAFLAAFEIGLSPADEPFLESVLDDKRKEVRRAASSLLGHLPESALVQRMIDRAKPLMKWLPGETGSALKLKKSKPASLEINLPQSCDKAMQRDGLEVKAKQGFGEKVWWLMQMLEVAPLDFWLSEWNVTPADILAASHHNDWKNELLEAWINAACRQRSAQWAEALFEVAIEGKRFDKFTPLLSALPLAQREVKLAAMLSRNDPKSRDLHGTLVAQCRHQWSEDFSRAVLVWLRRITSQPSCDWQLRNELRSFASRLAPTLLGEAALGWPTESPGWEFWSRGVDDFLAAVQFRSNIRTAFQPNIRISS